MNFDILCDCRKKTVVVSLWNDHAVTVGQELLEMADRSPVIAIKSVRVGDFQGKTTIFCLVFYTQVERAGEK